MEDQIRFFVKDKFYTLPISKIENFPIKETYLAILLKNYKNMNIKVKLHEGAIIIEPPHEEFDINFDLIVNIYLDPTKTLYEHLNLRELFIELRTLENVASPGSDSTMGLVELLRWSPQYKQIRMENFKKLFEMFEFFGIETLFYSKIDGYYSDEVVKRIKRSMKDMFLDKVITANHMTKPHFNFIHTMRQIGALMSGSFVLKHILNEKWQSNDIDLYVHQDLLFSQLKTSWVSTNNSKTNVENPKDEMKRVAKRVCELFGGQNPQYLKSDTGYRSIKGFEGIIRFQYYGFKVDLCLLSVTPQYFIEGFDFNFNKCYFDGHVVHHLKPKSLYRRRSVNLEFNRTGCRSSKLKFVRNLRRIEKYWERGFYVCPQTEVYVDQMHAKRKLKQIEKNKKSNPGFLMELTGNDPIYVLPMIIN